MKPVGRIFGIPFFDVESRLTRSQRNALSAEYGKLYFYDIRHDDECQGRWCQIQEFVMVNHWTTIITLEPIFIPQEICEEDWYYTNEYLTLSEFIAMNRQERRAQ